MMIFSNVTKTAIRKMKNNANEAMKKVWMPPNSGPGGAEHFIREYEQACLMELRAGLVASTELALANRLCAYKDKLPPEVLKYLKALPAYEQPKSLGHARGGPQVGRHRTCWPDQ